MLANRVLPGIPKDRGAALHYLDQQLLGQHHLGQHLSGQLPQGFQKMVAPQDSSWRESMRLDLVKGTRYEKRPYTSQHRLYIGVADGMSIARVWTCWYSKI